MELKRNPALRKREQEEKELAAFQHRQRDRKLDGKAISRDGVKESKSCAVM